MAYEYSEIVRVVATWRIYIRRQLTRGFQARPKEGRKVVSRSQGVQN